MRRFDSDRASIKIPHKSSVYLLGAGLLYSPELVVYGMRLGATTIDQNVQRRRAVRPFSKIHSRKIIQKELLGEVPAKGHGRDWFEIWLKGNSRDGNCAFWESCELNEGNKPSDAKNCVVGLERRSEADSTTA